MIRSLRLESVTKKYPDDDGRKRSVVHDVSFEIFPGEIVWLRGQSGSGKSTILNMSALLSTPNSGKIWINDTLVTPIKPKDAAALRATEIGMVFQSSNLLPELTATENVLLASRKNLEKREILNRLDEFGLGTVVDRKAKKLSGGQQQRVAFCRALINRPSLLLADEPNSGLDDVNSDAIVQAMNRAALEGCAVLVASHDTLFAQVATRTITMAGGFIESV